jgi:hypothetical protein
MDGLTGLDGGRAAAMVVMVIAISILVGVMNAHGVVVEPEEVLVLVEAVLQRLVVAEVVLVVAEVVLVVAEVVLVVEDNRIITYIFTYFDTVL